MNFLDKVRYDRSLADAEKKGHEHEIQLLSSREVTFKNELEFIKTEIYRFGQRRVYLSQELCDVLLQKKKADTELLKIKHDISLLVF